MRPSALRVTAALLYAAFLLLPLACAAPPSPYLTRLPSDLRREPEIHVLVASAVSPVVSRGGDMEISAAGRTLLRSAARPGVAFSSSGGSVVLAGRRLAPVVRLEGSFVLDCAGVPLEPPLLVRASSGGVDVAAVMPFEDYVARVVQGEMPLSWPSEALKAQAVAARSYALTFLLRKGRNAFMHVGATPHTHQTVRFEPLDDRAVTAAERTAGEVLVYRGRLLMSFYHAVSGGRTASAGSVFDGETILPLSSVRLPEPEDAPNSAWRHAVSWPAACRLLFDLSPAPSLLGVSVVRGGDDTVLSVRFRTSRGTLSISARRLRAVLGADNVKSNWFRVDLSKGGLLVFSGRGYGHRVGMSQYGAKALALRGFDHVSILRTFYPGASVVRVYRIGGSR